MCAPLFPRHTPESLPTRTPVHTPFSIHLPHSIPNYQAALELEKLSEAQRSAAAAEEKKNRKLAKQALLTGKAREYS